MPIVRPFRALRYSAEVVPDLSAVVAPPYDVISPEQRRVLAERDRRNIVHVDLPVAEPGDGPDEHYRRAARLLSAWRADGTLRRDVRPSLYAYEQTFHLDDAGAALIRRGVFAAVDLEPFGPGSGVRPHERTLRGPKEDRYRLLRATGVNTSPVVGLYEDPSGEIPARLQALARDEPPVADVVDDDAVRHRLWQIEADGLPARLGAGPITIADGHHRYETALRYRDERRLGSVAGEPAPFDSILMLLLEPAAGPLAVLATHRVIRHLEGDGLGALEARLGEVFEARSAATRDELAAAFSPGSGSVGGERRFGLWTRDGGSLLRARRDVPGASGSGSTRAVDRLDVSILGRALEALVGLDRSAVDAGGRIAYTKDAREAMAWVDAGADGADAAFLLDPTPPSEIVAVAAEGDVMPQKSTYIYPKALTGLVINPLE